MILELGLRYRPSGQTEIQNHMDRLELLMQDLADIPTDRLQIAINAWIAKSPYLPKASDLIDHTRRQLAAASESKAHSDRIAGLRAAIPRWNAQLYHERPDLRGKAEWRVTDDGQAYIHDLDAIELGQRRLS